MTPKAILWLPKFPENPGICLKAVWSISHTVPQNWAMLTYKTQYQENLSFNGSYSQSWWFPSELCFYFLKHLAFSDNTEKP